MSEDVQAAVDEFLVSNLVGDDPVLTAALAANAAGGLPAIDVAPNQGKLLYLLAKMSGASRILEIGTLGGYSTIWLARAVGDSGLVVTLEYEPRHAAVAQSNLDRAGLGHRVQIRIGAALQSLAQVQADAAEPFDFVFIDADKENNPNYVEWALLLTHPGSVIVVDNVVRAGQIVDPEVTDSRVAASRELIRMMGAHPRLDATALQTVGSKGWDGFALAVVT